MPSSTGIELTPRDPSHRPALTVVIVDIYDPQWLLEIEAFAAA